MLGRSRHVWALALWALGAALVSGPARADEGPSPVRLETHRAPGTERCPADETIRDAVSMRLGYDPWSPEAARTIRVQLSAGRAGLAARIEIDDGAGGAGEHALGSAQRDCQDLTDALVLAIAIAIDPLALSAPRTDPSPPAPAPPPVVVAAAQPPVVDPAPVAGPAVIDMIARPSPPAPRSAVRLLGPGIGLVVVSGSGPGAAFGIDLGVGMRVPHASIELAGRFTMPRSTEHAGGRVSAWVLSAGLVPCARLGRVAVCGVALAGAMRASAEGLAEENDRGSPWAAAGARLALELPFAGVMAVRLHGDALAALTRTSVVVDEETVWRSPGFSLAAGVSLLGAP